jgi:hypothetical protein
MGRSSQPLRRPVENTVIAVRRQCQLADAHYEVDRAPPVASCLRGGL